MKGQIIIYDHFKRYQKEKYLVLYTHNKGQELLEILQKTTESKLHLEDFDYFNRLLLLNMVGEDNDDWGYGISLTKKVGVKTYEIDFESKRYWTIDDNNKIKEYFF